MHVFLIAQAFRMLHDADHEQSSVAVSRLLSASAYGPRLQILQTMACLYSTGSSAAQKPAPLCLMCRALFPKAKHLSGKNKEEVNTFLGKLSNAMRSTLMIDAASTMIGGEYVCVGEMPQCRNLNGGCPEEKPITNCPFVR